MSPMTLELDDYRLPDDVAAGTLSPALVVYVDRVRDNLCRVIDRLDGRTERWRPHVKTVKIPAILAELVGAGLRGFKCATTREADTLAEVLGEAGVLGGDVLVAQPLVGPGLSRLDAIARARPETRFSVLCESPAVVDELPATLDVFVDVNPGMDRTGLAPAKRGVVAEVARRAGSRFRGIHFYDGQLHELEHATRRREAHAGYDTLVELVVELQRSGLRVPEVTTSGTPTFLDALEYTGFSALPDTVHRVSPGTVVYHDLRSEAEVPGLGLAPAALVLARVVSRPCDDVVTCDAGSKSIAAEAGDPCAVAVGWPGLRALRPSEEHLPLRVVDGPRPERGTELLLVPRHVCPTVNLAEEAILIESGAGPVVAPVTARAHELRLRPLISRR